MYIELFGFESSIHLAELHRFGETCGNEEDTYFEYHERLIVLNHQAFGQFHRETVYLNPIDGREDIVLVQTSTSGVT